MTLPHDTPGPRPRLSDLGFPWQEMVDVAANWQSELLRRTAALMAEGLDRDAMAAIEGARDWRALTSRTFKGDEA